MAFKFPLSEWLTTVEEHSCSWFGEQRGGNGSDLRDWTGLLSFNGLKSPRNDTDVYVCVLLCVCPHLLASICGHPSCTCFAVCNLFCVHVYACVRMCVLVRRRLGGQQDTSASTAIDYSRRASESRLTALQSWAIVKVNSFGNKPESWREGGKEGGEEAQMREI